MAIEKLNLDPKVKGEIGAKPTIEYISATGNKIDELIENAIVVESGTNENGTYMRYANGVQVCFAKLGKEKFMRNTPYYETVQNLKIYRSVSAAFTYPKAFKDNNEIVAQVSINNEGNGSRIIIPEIGPGSKEIYIQLLSLEDFTPTGVAYTNLNYVYYFAIGKWK